MTHMMSEWLSFGSKRNIMRHPPLLPPRRYPVPFPNRLLRKKRSSRVKIITFLMGLKKKPAFKLKKQRTASTVEITNSPTSRTIEELHCSSTTSASLTAQVQMLLKMAELREESLQTMAMELERTQHKNEKRIAELKKQWSSLRMTSTLRNSNIGKKRRLNFPRRCTI